MASIIIATNPSVADTSKECQKAVETGPNATLLDASEKWVTVLDTTRLNGTIGLVHFRNLDTKERLYLQGPNGWESEVHKPLDDTLAIPDVPLCNTGTWDLVRNDTGEAVAQFNSTESEDLLGDDSTFQVDYPWYDDILYDKEYQAGKLEAYVDSDGNTGTNAYWTGDTSPPGYPATCCARVDWHVRANYEFWGGGSALYTAYYGVCTDGHEQKWCTYYTESADTRVVLKKGSYEMKLAPEWKAGGVYDGEIYVQLFESLDYGFKELSDSRDGATVLPTT